jgi:hypothetical protein
MGFRGDDLQTLFDAAQALFELAEEKAMADGGGVILHDRTPQSDELVIEALFHRHEIGGDVGAQGAHLRTQIVSLLVNFPIQAANILADIAKKLEDDTFRFTHFVSLGCFRARRPA